MKFMNWFPVVALAATLAACGGGGGDSPTSVNPPVQNPPVVTPPVQNPPVVTPPVTAVVCPDISTATSAAQCPAVIADVTALQGTTQDPALFGQGLVIQFNGALDTSKTVVTWTQGDLVMPSSFTTSITNGVTRLTPVTQVRIGYGSIETITVAGVDSVGRPVHLTLTFNTTQMSCTSNAKWSNPANLSSTFHNCATPVGEQALFDPVLNTRQPGDGCTFTPGLAMSAECMSISANGTLVLNDTSVIVENNPVEWIGYNSGTPGNLTGTIVLVDKTTMKVVGTKQLNGQIFWTIGNPYGEAVRYQVIQAGHASTFQARWDGAAIVTTCVANCT